MTDSSNATSLHIASRASALALCQVDIFVDALKVLGHPIDIHLHKIITEGDRDVEHALSDIGGKSLFVKELERSLLDGTADVAVHSMKDVAIELSHGLTIAAVLPRLQPSDAFVSNRCSRIEQLPLDSLVGTSSLRRRHQLEQHRPDLKTVLLRGNVQTRLRKLDEGYCDAVILACAGLMRLGLGERISQILPRGDFVPSIGQGVIGIECNLLDEKLLNVLKSIDDPVTRICLTAERHVGAALGADCHTPLGVFAQKVGKKLVMQAWLHNPCRAGVPIRIEPVSANWPGTPLPTRVVDAMVEQGAHRFIRRCRELAASP